jgi:hypothetical protein
MNLWPALIVVAVGVAVVFVYFGGFDCWIRGHYRHWRSRRLLRARDRNNVCGGMGAPRGRR